MNLGSPSQQDRKRNKVSYQGTPKHNDSRENSQSNERLMVNQRARPSANFVSKVPREKSQEGIFTGCVDFNDQSSLTISNAQNKLTLKTVQKMFAGRQE